MITFRDEGDPWPGSYVVLLGEGQGWGVYRAGRSFELRRGGEGSAVARGDVVGVLKKFNR
jgi:hypothetical protein